MKLVGADISFGGEKITFSFYADERVDFRSLVADLAKALKTRIELRQVGAREEARMVGGLGPCGRGLCCTLFPPGDEPGVHPHGQGAEPAAQPGEDLRSVRPSHVLPQVRAGSVRALPQGGACQGHAGVHSGGQGVVVGYNVLKDAITVRLEDGHSTDIRICSCQCQPDGCLLVVPELDELAEPVDLVASLSAIGGLGGSDAGAASVADAIDPGDEELAVVEAEVVLGANGEPVEIIVAETSRRSRSRRSRGRRGGRDRAKAPGEGAAAGDNAGTTGSGGSSGSGAGSGAEGGTAGSPGGGAGGGSSSRSRRRRRPRRPGGGESGGSGGGAAGGSPGGSSGSAGSSD